ncbi:hypothetical protein LY76DRAFT_240219 [Colletotrichum caudatum]|nr:hypothetical protein LY76DRAFT_240219 [Colletotrichum caudatum]
MGNDRGGGYFAFDVLEKGERAAQRHDSLAVFFLVLVLVLWCFLGGFIFPSLQLCLFHLCHIDDIDYLLLSLSPSSVLCILFSSGNMHILFLVSKFRPKYMYTGDTPLFQIPCVPSASIRPLGFLPPPCVNGVLGFYSARNWMRHRFFYAFFFTEL